MGNLKVSILIPAFNVDQYLSQCLDSVINQTYSNLQIVIVDDGSKDNTLEICKSYAERDDRVEFYTQDNQGVAVTRNHLLEKVKGEYVLFVDADDWIELDMVDYLVALATEHSAGMVMCDRVINDTKPIDSCPNIKIILQDEAIKDFLFHEYFIGSLCNKLIKASLLNDIKFNKDISYGEDALFVWKVLQNLNKVAVSSKQLYHYRMNEDSISHQSFGEKKLSGHVTWQYITDDVRQVWPQYLDIALGTFALQDFYLIQTASVDRFAGKESIRLLQNTVKQNLRIIKNRCSTKLYISAFFSTFWLGYFRLYHCLYKIKRVFK